MDWMVLLLIAAAILVPIVLLWGFAGCDYNPRRVPPAPTIVSAIPVQPFTVELAWTDEAEGPVTFEIERTKGTGTPEVFPAEPNEFSEPYRFVDAPLDGGTHYTYRVRRIGTGTPPEDWSLPVTIETFARAFASGVGGPNGANEIVPGVCVVQRLSPDTLGLSGNLIALSVRGAGDGDLVLSRVTISKPSTVGNEFDSAAKPVDVLPSPVTVSAGVIVGLPPAEFTVNAAEELMFAFDIGDPGFARFERLVTHQAFTKTPPLGGPPVTEAGTQNRAGFIKRPVKELWMIVFVDIATQFKRVP